MIFTIIIALLGLVSLVGFLVSWSGARDREMRFFLGMAAALCAVVFVFG